MKVILTSLGFLILCIFAYEYFSGDKPTAENDLKSSDASHVHTDDFPPKAQQLLEEQSLAALRDFEASGKLSDQVLEALALASSEDRLERLRLLLKELNSTNLSDVLSVIESNVPPTKANVEVYKLLLAQWAQFAGDDAVDYAMTSLDGDVRLDAGVAASRSWASLDVVKTAEFLRDMPGGYGKDYLVYDFVTPYIEQDPGLALQWVRTLPVSLKTTATHHATDYWLNRDPVAVTQWVVQNANPVEETESIRLTAVYWTRQDLDQAELLVQSLPDDKSKSTAMVATVDWLASFHPEKVAGWLNRYESSPMLDPALATFARIIATEDMESSLSWAEAITDDEMREAFIAEIYRQNAPPDS